MTTSCSPDQRARILKDLGNRNLVAGTLLLTAWGIQVLFLLADPDSFLRGAWESGLLPLLGWGFGLAGSFALARRFHRHWALGFLGILYFFGPALLFLLARGCGQCGIVQADFSLNCRSCDAPL